MMKQMQKSFFAIAVLLSAANLVASSSTVTTCSGSSPYFFNRPQGVNVVRDIVGWENLINRCDQDCFYGGFAITGEFSQTFRNGRIARSLFGNGTVTSSTVSTATNCGTNCGTSCDSSCNTACYAISGSRAADRGANDWLADYFGLPTDYVGQICFSPRIRNFVADVQFYFGLDDWASGLYFRLDLPITWSRWDLRACETVTTEGTLGYERGYFAPDAVTVDNLNSTALEFFTGSVPTLPNGVTFQPLNGAMFCGSFNNCDTNCNSNGCNTRTRLADVAMVLGWNFICCEDYHFGLGIRALAPTGNKPCGTCIFEPIVGNGGHWELGGNVSAHAVLWRCDESDSTWAVYLEGNITHLFNACQTRVFDLVGRGPNSRYMLAQRLGANEQNLNGNPTEGELVDGNTLSVAQFADEFAPVANLTKTQVNVSVGVQGDVALKFEYANGCGFVWDIGYDFWGTSCEKFCRKSNCGNTSLTDGATWALKGDAQVYGFASDPYDTPVALAATQSTATITGGNNGFVAGDNTVAANVTASRNPGIDNPQFAIALDPLVQVNAIAGDDATQTRTSIQPVFLSDASVDLAGTKGISHKIFTHFNYQWRDCEDWTPFLGVGASVEFGPNDCNTNCNTNCSTSCNTSCGSNNTSCVRSPLNQWAVWIKGGVVWN